MITGGYQDSQHNFKKTVNIIWVYLEVSNDEKLSKFAYN